MVVSATQTLRTKAHKQHYRLCLVALGRQQKLLTNYNATRRRHASKLTTVPTNAAQKLFTRFGTGTAAP